MVFVVCNPIAHFLGLPNKVDYSTTVVYSYLGVFTLENFQWRVENQNTLLSI